MQALVKLQHGPGHVELKEISEPHPSKGQVKIGVKATGICGSDLHIYNDDIAIKIKPPVVIGHEFSGVITELGEGVTGWKVGDRVVSELGFEVCGQCYNCQAGFPNLCDSRKSLGYWYDGAFTSFTVTLAEGLHSLPGNISFSEGSLTEPLACAVHAVLELTWITAGDLVLISGPGTIGLLALQVAKTQGAKTIVSGVGTDASRLEIAEQLGADYVVNIEHEDLEETVARLSGRSGVDVVLECSGNERAVNTGLQLLRKRGQFTQIGLFGRPITVDFEKVCFKEIRVTGSLGQRRSAWDRALQFMEEGRVQLKPLVSHVLNISEWKKAFEMFENNKGLKIVLTPDVSSHHK